MITGVEDASKIRKDLWNTINSKEKANINLLHDEDVQSICIDGKEILLRVEKYDDRFVLTNPGLLKLPLEQIYAGGESKAHNQRMQNMLRMIGYGENLGSGFPSYSQCVEREALVEARTHRATRINASETYPSHRE